MSDPCVIVVSVTDTAAPYSEIPTSVLFGDASEIVDFLVGSDADVGSSKRALTQLQQLQIAVDFKRAKVGANISEAAKAGTTAPLHSVLNGKGQISSRHSKNQAAQSQALELVAELAAETEPISGDYLEVVTRQVKRLDEHHRHLLDGNWVVRAIRTMPVDKFRKLLSRKIERIDRELREKETGNPWRNSSISHWMNRNTSEGLLSGHFAPNEYEQLAKAIDAEARRMAHGEDLNYRDGTLAAQALLNLVRAGSAPNSEGAWGNNASQPKPLIEVVVDRSTFATGELAANGFCETSMGNPVSMETLSRYMCDSSVRNVVLDSTTSNVDVGRKYRTATDKQRAAARAMYSTCAWDGCQARFDWCEMHHIEHWQDGGPTDLDNLVPLCTEHHHLVHEGKWSIKLKPDRRMEHYKPDGTHWKTSDPPTRRILLRELKETDVGLWAD